MRLSTPLQAPITNDLRERDRSGRRHALGGRRSSRPLLEVLEDRTPLAVITVQNTSDSGTGSLRAAIGSAFPGSTINFASGVTGTIKLTSGPLDIEENLFIEGPGAGSLTISGNEAGRVFIVGDSNNATIAAIAGLTIANASTSLPGGGIFNGGTLTVTNCVLSNNSASFGGGIDNAGTLAVTNSTLSGNKASPNDEGGGIENLGTLTVTNSTFTGNSAGNGGGILAQGTATITNCTISGNKSANGAGGILSNGVTTMTNCTVSGNTAVFGAGVYAAQGATTLFLANTIISGNSAALGPDVNGAVTSQGFNIIGNSSGGSGFVATDLLNVNPLLGPFQNNGGPTETMALLPGSPAIAAGSLALIPAGTITDQRGAARVVNGTVDIGAVEVQLYLVYTTADSGGGSLRSALTQANQFEGSTIAFTASGLIALASPLPAISRDVQILGPGANNLTVSGNGANQVFDVNQGATATITGLTIADGSATNGGGILNDGTLTVTNCTLSGNSASSAGGGIDNAGTLMITNCTISGNSSASGDGGGIWNGGTLTVTNCTISGNSSASGDGGVDNKAGTVSLANTIIATNTAPMGPEVDGAVTSRGFNLIGNSSGGSGFVASDLLNVNPLLGPLQNNGGPTATMALLPGSRAIAAGSVALVPAGITTDQRGSSAGRLISVPSNRAASP
jgi:predicted outer membrane repeat protein